MSIRILDEQTANRIAAGEVVERPSSIVKELVENAVDAGATAVTVEIREGGIGYLRVTDNGGGIAAQDVPTAFLRHATSKIHSGDDLMGIKTIGFRGEALASIAAVSFLEMTTRQTGVDFGTKIELQAGKPIACHQAGCPEGTTVIVSNLFYNTPARRKFLKKPAREAGYVGDVIAALILSRPELSIRLINNGKTIYHSPGDGQLLSALFSVYGREVAQHVKPVDYQSEGIVVQGYVGGPEISRSNRAWQSLVINGRSVRHFPIIAAVESVYNTRLMSGRFPFALLHITLPFDQVDVNVHPNKTEVRLAKDYIVRQVVGDAVALALDGKLPTVFDSLQPSNPGIEQSKATTVLQSTPKTNQVTQTTSVSRVAQAPQTMQVPHTPQASKTAQNVSDGQQKPTKIAPNPLPMDDTASTVQQDQQEQQVQWIPTAPRGALQIKETAGPVIMPGKPAHTGHVAPVAEQMPGIQPQDDGRYIGQLFSTYLLVENGTSLYVIDQHAAHERLIYERFQKMIKNQQVQSQTLLAPHVIEVTASEAVWIDESIDTFTQLGFDVAMFGPRSYRISAVPMFMGQPQAAAFFLEVLDSMMDIPKDIASRKERLAQMACKTAVKAGKTMSQAEVTELLRTIRDEQTPLSCPHGRPILIKLDKKQFDKWFGRMV